MTKNQGKGKKPTEINSYEAELLCKLKKEVYFPNARKLLVNGIIHYVQYQIAMADTVDEVMPYRGDQLNDLAGLYAFLEDIQPVRIIK